MEENGNGEIQGVTTTGEVRYGQQGAENNAGSYDPFANNPINGNTIVNNASETIANAVNVGELGGKTASSALPTQQGFWSKVKTFLFQEITIELSPRQKKIERELNDFLFQEITWFGKKKNK